MRSWLIASLLAVSALGAGTIRAQKLSPEAQKVVQYLLQDWSQRMHSTSIPLAISNLGLPLSDELRLEVGEHFRKNPDLARNLTWWGANNYILSNSEKRLAKFLIRSWEGQKRLPSKEEVIRELRMSPQEGDQALNFMARAGLLVASTGENLGYSLAENYARWGGPLRYNYHTVTIGEEKPFDVF